ncbi:MAG: hypothetical protein MUP63_02400 [Candidatus Nanohaloarchaeota archaeon QJJ-7]|nr:hypothetical protein [Candidatus Nanohaloarchaeota archaeon QJJ-7]
MTEALELGVKQVAVIAFLGGFLAAGTLMGGINSVSLDGNPDNLEAKTGDDTSLDQRVQEVKSKVIPEKNSPTGYGASYSDTGMQEMVSWQEDIELSGESRQRYIDLGNREGTSCEYCCGATAAVSEEGSVACQCEHNLALSGLIKYLVKNTDMTDQEILEEVEDWKGFFFPQEVLKQELDERGISPSSSGLPEMRGDC